MFATDTASEMNVLEYTFFSEVCVVPHPTLNISLIVKLGKIAARDINSQKYVPRVMLFFKL